MSMQLDVPMTIPRPQWFVWFLGGAVLFSFFVGLAISGGGLATGLAVLTWFGLLPGLIAYERRHRQTLAITVLTILLGWTGLGWIIALVWACTSPRQ